MLMKMKIIAILGASLLLLAGCGRQTTDISEVQSFQDQLLEQLIGAKPGDVILIPEGIHKIDRSLSLNVDGVTIRGMGMDKSILSFTDQVAGAEGLLVTANDFTIEDLAIEDTIGDGLKVTEGDNIILRRVRVEWTNGPDTENGAYGLYPVQTTNVLVEGCVAIGASDAGIYVGQSKNVIMRNNRAEKNVAGIEIENTINADVYQNIATGNTGGILVFNMPHLKQAGYGTRVFNNEVYENNHPNFAHKGTPVSSVPAGSGIVVNSNDGVEIFNNRVADNNTANIIISSLFSTGYSDEAWDENFDPYPEAIFIYDNEFQGGGRKPGLPDLEALRLIMFGMDGRFPDILWDGFYDEAKMKDGVMPDDLRLCVMNGEAEMINVDLPNGAANPALVAAEHRCTLKKLPAVTLSQLP